MKLQDKYTDKQIIKALIDIDIADGDEFQKYTVAEFLGSMDIETIHELAKHLKRSK